VEPNQIAEHVVRYTASCLLDKGQLKVWNDAIEKRLQAAVLDAIKELKSGT
jgi:hypothetical protein